MQQSDSSLPPIHSASRRESNGFDVLSLRRETYDVAKVASKDKGARGSKTRRSRRRHTYDADGRSRPHPLTLTGDWKAVSNKRVLIEHPLSPTNYSVHWVGKDSTTDAVDAWSPARVVKAPEVEASPIRLSAAAAASFAFKSPSLKKQASAKPERRASAGLVSQASVLEYQHEKQKELVERGRLLLKRRADQRKRDKALKVALARAMEKEREKEKGVRRKLELLKKQQLELQKQQEKEREKQRRLSRRGSFTSTKELHFMLEASQRKRREEGATDEDQSKGAPGSEKGKPNKAARRRASLSIKLKRPSLKKTNQRGQDGGQSDGYHGDDGIGKHDVDVDDNDDEECDEGDDDDDRPTRRPSQLERLTMQIARSLPAVDLAAPIAAMESIGTQMERALAKIFGDD